MQDKVNRFLHDTQMHYDCINLDVSLRDFLEEMRRGLAGEQSSLMMLPTYIQAGGKVPMNEEIIVMDAGGTNFRVATVTFREEGALIQNFQKYPMPGTQGRIGREEFFDTIADRLMPVIHVSDCIGFCFSYPTEIQPNRDGRMLYFSKEVYVDDVEGQLVGEGINRALRKRGVAPKRFVLLNDTVATMLGGIAVTQGEAFDSYIGYILGTGTNTCYLEACGNITKSQDAVAMEGTMAVNMESGGYNRYLQGKADRAVDEATANPGIYTMEKMISGFYQGKVIFETVRLAVDAGLFSETFGQRLEPKSDFSMYEIDQFCFHPYGANALAQLCEGCEADALTLYEIIDASFERAARITAVNLAAILVQTGTGANPTRPVCVTAEGTTFYKSKLFKGKLDFYVRTFLGDTLGVYCEFHKAEDVTLVGTAVAGLLN